MPQTIAVLDFGSQYTQVIARRIRECQVYSKIYHFATPAAELREDGVDRHHPLRRPAAASLPKRRRIPTAAIFELGVPVLGICYGIQLMGHLLGGRGGARASTANTATAHLTIKKPGQLFAGLPQKAPRLEFPRRQADRAAAGLHAPSARPRTRRYAAHRGPRSAISTASSFTRRFSTPSAAWT